MTYTYECAAGGGGGPPVVTRRPETYGGPVYRRCGDCGGAGRVTLLVTRRPCLACGGTGIVAAPDDLAGDGGGGTAGTSAPAAVGSRAAGRPRPRHRPPRKLGEVDGADPLKLPGS